MEKTTLYLPTDLQRGLRELSRRTGRPQAEIIREALGRYVADQTPPWPTSIGSAADGSVTARESEAWIRREWSKPRVRASRQPRRR